MAVSTAQFLLHSLYFLSESLVVFWSSTREIWDLRIHELSGSQEALSGLFSSGELISRPREKNRGRPDRTTWHFASVCRIRFRFCSLRRLNLPRDHVAARTISRHHPQAPAAQASPADFLSSHEAGLT